MHRTAAQGMARLLDDLVASGQCHEVKLELGPLVEPLSLEERRAVVGFTREAELIGAKVFETRTVGTVHLSAYVPQHRRA